MAASTVAATDLEGAMELICNSEVDVVYLVDSFGSFYSEQVHYLLDLYKKYAARRGKTLGMHAHNNQQLAYANTIEAAIKGANLLDSSMAGLGRGAGNCQTELLLGFLHNPKYQLRPVLQCIQEYIEPMRAELGWGFDIPYMITGMLNQHPRTAMAFNAGEHRGNLVKFYDSVVLESE
jgi:4-hydroxy 2-oxovalerate aldolase